MRSTLHPIREDLPSLFLLALMLCASAGGIASSGWTQGLWSLPGIALIGLLTGYLLTLSHFSGMIALLFSTAYGSFFVVLLHASRLPAEIPLRERMLEVIYRLGVWGQSAARGGASRDSLIFVLLLSVVFWYLGFNAAWNLFRTRRIWLAAIPPAVALLINLYYYYGPVGVEALLIGYLFLTLLLAVRTAALTREWQWRAGRVTFAPGTRSNSMRAGLVATFALLAVAWMVPAAPPSNRLASAWERIAEPWFTVRDTWNRLFGALEGGRNTAADYYGGRVLSLGGEVYLSDRPVMQVYAPPGPHYYWRSKVFDTYDNGIWTTSSDARLRSEFGGLPQPEEPAARRNVRQRFVLAVPASRLVYAAPQPLSVGLPISYDALFLDPSGARVSAMVIRVDRDTLRSGDAYQALSSISVADETSLRLAGTDYPAWVTDTYLQLPDQITPRTRQLAALITAEQSTPYDKASAIETWLRQNIVYNQAISPPPEDVEPVDWLLFETHEGYCNYYASAMVVMARSVGIPTRLAVGFSQGEYDDKIGAYNVVEHNAHTWVEGYFPGYGWIEFEPTASESPIVRPEVPPAPAHDDSTLPDSGPEDEHDPRDERDEGPYPQETGPVRAMPGTSALIGSLMMALILGFAGLVATFVWLSRYRQRRLSPVSRAYAMLNTYAPWLGLHLAASATPHERGEALAEAVPEGADPIRAIAALYARQRYGPPPPTPVHASQADALALHIQAEARGALLRCALARRLGRFGRLIRLHNWPGPRPD
jgi:transglutaminase-like putative cysteine protease